MISHEHRLATYGTLAPGRPNAHQLADLNGSWSRGMIRGHLYPRGWGAATGYPGIVLAEDGPLVEVHLFTSDDLPAHWPRIDAFEGPGYRRVPVTVTVEEVALRAQVYELVLPEQPDQPPA